MSGDIKKDSVEGFKWASRLWVESEVPRDWRFVEVVGFE